MEKVEKKDYQKPELVKYENLKNITRGEVPSDSTPSDDLDS